MRDFERYSLPHYGKCFAIDDKGCRILQNDDGCGADCPFYKPAGMTDWIRSGDTLVEPEEYYRE